MAATERERVSKTRIGGSEVPAIFRAHEFLSEFGLWARKKGGLPPAPASQRMDVGQILEPSMVRLYAHFTGREAKHFNRSIADPDRPFMSYSPDAFCTDERRGIEIKWVNWDQRFNWGNGANENDIPMRVVLQAWWYMAGMDMDVWDVFALIGGMPRVWTIQRDREAEQSMLQRAKEWHERYILGDDRPPMGGTAEAASWLQHTYPKHRENSLREATPEEIEMLDTYITVRAMLFEAEHERKVLECEIKAAIGDDEGLRWPWGKFTWRKTKDTEKINWQAIALGLLNKFVPDAEERKTLIGIQTRTKPGTRRIHVTHPGLKPEHEEEEQEVSA